MPRSKRGFGKGVLRRAKGLERFGGGRFHPPCALEPWVEHFWTTHWDLGDDPPYHQDVLPHPSINVVLEPGRSEVVGVMTGKFTRVLEGQGRVVAAMFWPAGFHAFYRGPVRELTDRRVSLGDIFDVDVDALEERVFCAADDAQRIQPLEELLLRTGPQLSDDATKVRAWVAMVVSDPAILRVDQLAKRVDTNVRTLQRLFARYVGVSPKWVIRRNRLHEAAERLADPKPPDLAALAVELGYADQAHFIRDFGELVGSTPAEYVRQL